MRSGVSQVGDPYADIVSHGMLTDKPLWALTSPLRVDNAEAMHSKPFFRGYEEVREVALDYKRLSATATYTHLAVMCSIARKMYNPDEPEGIEEREPPVYFDLLDTIFEGQAH
jgi:hypothetical protein